ncbi:MAG: hypothetical protein ACFFG0_07870 [Candidatus Thorarchaeota archaeon]
MAFDFVKFIDDINNNNNDNIEIDRLKRNIESIKEKIRNAFNHYIKENDKRTKRYIIENEIKKNIESINILLDQIFDYINQLFEI